MAMDTTKAIVKAMIVISDNNLFFIFVYILIIHAIAVNKFVLYAV